MEVTPEVKLQRQRTFRRGGRWVCLETEAIEIEREDEWLDQKAEEVWARKQSQLPETSLMTCVTGVLPALIGSGGRYTELVTEDMF